MSKQPSGEIILYERDGTPAIDVRLISDTVWLSLNQLADLLGRDKSTISRHISNVFAEGELERSSVVAEFATTAIDGTICATSRGRGDLSGEFAICAEENSYRES